MKPKGNFPVFIVLLLLFLLPHESDSQRPFRGRRRQRQRARKLGAAAAAVGGGGAAAVAVGAAEGRIPARRVPGSRGRGRLNSAATTEAPAPFYDYYDYDYYDLPTAARQPQRPLRPAPRPIAQQEPAREVVTQKTKTKTETAEEDYDISELVAAWKDYIKEKKEQEEKPEEPNRGNPTGKRRPLPAATLEESAPVRPQTAPAPAFAGTSPGAAAYDYYDDYDYYYDTRRPSFHRPRRPNRPRFGGGNRFSSPGGGRPSAFGGGSAPADYQDLPQERPVSTSASRAPQNEYECEPQEEDSYRIPDEEQCDKFFECNIKGQLKEKLCPDGLVFDIKSENCDYPAKVNCTGRPTLQPAQPSKNCPRANGFFPFPSAESCQKFWDCREGRSYLQTCPAGVIFDNHVDACVTPDQAGRKDCTAIMFLGFECPTYGPEDVLRFGNHDRLPDPKDCQQFFSCLKTGEPRLGACPRKTVFNNATGHCGDPKSVKGCETYWEDKLKNGTEYDYYDY